MNENPKAIVLFCGKRKSGKDYVTNFLLERLGPELGAILRLSGPLKRQYAKEHNLDYVRLLDASDYKEKYRADMIRWGEERRMADPGFFCRLAAQGPGSEKPVWIVSDARRLTDVQYFLHSYTDRVITVRVQAAEEVRCERGWIFTPGVDDAESECGLDEGVTWDVLINNNGSKEELSQDLDKIVAKVHQVITI